MTAARRVTLIELVVAIGLVVLLTLSVLPLGTRLAAQHRQMTAYVDDLAACVRAIDRVALEVRQAARLAARTPDGAIAHGPSALVLVRPDGGYVAFQLAGDGPARALVQLTYPARGGAARRERLAVADALTLRFDARRPEEIRAVALDLALPRRRAGKAPALLSTRALVGSGEVGR